jgi:hypothetical protein
MAYKSLDNILNEDSDTTAEIKPALPEVEAETGEQPQPEPEAPEPEAEAGPPPAEDARKAGLEAGIAAERRKRQEIEAQLEALRREIQAKPAEPAPPPPSIWEDEQGAFQHFGGQAVTAAVQRATFEAKLNQSEFYARKNIEGFSDSWEEMNKWLVENPSVAQQATADFDPWGYAYRAFQNQRTMQELGATDLETLKAKMREELMAEMQAQAPAAPVIPRSLSTTRSVSGRNGPAWSGPPSLGDLLK